MTRPMVALRRLSLARLVLADPAHPAQAAIMANTADMQHVGRVYMAGGNGGFLYGEPVDTDTSGNRWERRCL